MPLKFNKPTTDGRVSAIDGAEPEDVWIRKAHVADDDYDENDAKQHDVLIVNPPTPAQFAYHVREQQAGDTTRTIASVVNFLDGMLNKDGKDVLARRLMDGDDDIFTFELISEMIADLIEVWTANPTPAPSASARSRSNGGKKSTAKPRSVESVS